MGEHEITRRTFIKSGAAAGIALAASRGSMANQEKPPPAQAASQPGKPGARPEITPRRPTADDQAAIAKTRSHNPGMEYRRLGKTGLWVSAVCLGGHWKRIDKMIATKGEISGYDTPGTDDHAAFNQNRSEVVSACLDAGINLVDACSGSEVMAYAKALQGRREKMFIAYSWYEREMRMEEWRTTAKLLAGLEAGLKEANLEYIDLWRVTCYEKGGKHTPAEVEQMVKALEQARRQGKCRFTGVSSHDRPWLKGLIESHPDEIQVILSPYTADSKELPTDSLFDAVRQHDVGFLGIKPFASNSLFKGDSSANSPHAEEDDRRARLAIRYILGNPAITAPIPGLVSVHQVKNVAAAVGERRELDQDEHAELREAGREMWARLPSEYEWLREWRNI
jgi:aryl-alcohol dehydrogenase-like predicted oxidoreductase